MEILQTAAPHPQLAAFVSIFAHRETSPGSSAVIQPVIASLEQTLTFELGDRPVMNFTSGRTIFHPRVYLIGARTTYQGATFWSSGSFQTVRVVAVVWHSAR